MPIIPSAYSTVEEYRVKSLQINRLNELLVNYLDEEDIEPRFIFSPRIFAFPVGAVYANTTEVNPQIELGYGIWEEIGKFRLKVKFIYFWERLE